MMRGNKVEDFDYKTSDKFMKSKKAITIWICRVVFTDDTEYSQGWFLEEDARKDAVGRFDFLEDSPQTIKECSVFECSVFANSKEI
jgi:hypothetical protein|tara:strand:- start:203 stop:460 length:258 start_codon:yes stop_codon:yes gene_type:complete